MNISRTTFRLAAVAAWIALPAAATTIQVVSDANLVQRAPIIASGFVESKGGPLLDRPVTDWTVSVERVLKGTISAGRIIVRVPGGEAPDGRRLMIYGTPPFEPGQRTLLFLVPGPDGTYALQDFPQGAFLAARTPKRDFALRDFSRVTVIGGGSGHVGSRRTERDFDRFADWIADRAAGWSRPPDYMTRPSQTEKKSITSAFTVFDEGGLNLRWFEFDSGGSVTYKRSAAGMPGLPDGGTAALKTALASWTNEPTTPVRLVYGGTSTSTQGFQNADGQQVVLFNDPNQEIPGTFTCGSGGTLGIGGPWYDNGVTGVFNGKTFLRILEADAIINDGIDCFQFTSNNYPNYIAKLVAHEVGHTLGLGHSSENQFEPNPTLKQAVMYFRAVDNGKGPILNSDDIAGLQFLYQKGGSGGGGGGSKPPASGCPAGTAPNTLCLLKGRFHVTGTWSNQFDGSSGTAMPVVNSDLSGFFYFTDPGNIELIVKILDFGTEIKVFYSQLTNLKFTLNVTDTSTGRTKTYANTPGDCGAIDQNFSNALTASSSTSLSAITAAASSGTCVADSRTLCTLDNRFAITVDWRNQFNGVSGTGSPKKLTNLTGAFSFDDPANLEILIKTLEFPDKILVIYGSLSNFEYTIRVTDTTTSKVKEYKNAAGNYCGGLDENAF